MSNPTPDPPKPPAGDPQMDDILASIRRILNEDEAQGAASATQPPAAGEPLELTEAMMVQPEPTAEAAPPITPPVVPPVTPPVAPLAAAPSPQAPPAPVALPPGADALIGPAVAAATTQAIGQLLRAVADERAAPVHRGGPTIEDVVREELRPLLKSWLDQHLPPIVERLVRVEIERVVGRALP
jgi:cell pole-organizing protein PopZ